MLGSFFPFPPPFLRCWLRDLCEGFGDTGVLTEDVSDSGAETIEETEGPEVTKEGTDGSVRATPPVEDPEAPVEGVDNNIPCTSTDIPDMACIRSEETPTSADGHCCVFRTWT